MARRQKKEKQGVSLFPFLSILACVIGVLTLMITAVALGQMDNESVADIEQFEQAQADSAQLDIEIANLIEQLRKERANTSSSNNELTLKQRELEDLLRKLAEIQKNKPQPVSIATVDRKQLDQRLAKLQEELKDLQQQIKSAEAQIKEKKLPPEPAVVKIRPGGSGVDIEPTFVECAGASVVVYDGQKSRRIVRNNLATDKEFLALLDEIANQPKASMIFLVRENGLGTYYAARNLARSRYARNGKLPVLGQGKIDLSVFYSSK